MHEGIDGNFYYSNEEAMDLIGVIVMCDEKDCDGAPCGKMHNHPHVYNDRECFASCQHQGHHGKCCVVKQ